MPSEDTKILEFSQYKKSDQDPFIVYADLECLIEKIDGCKNNTENSFTTKEGEHIQSGFLMSITAWSRDWMKKLFMQSLREHALKINNFKKKTMKLLTKEQQESSKNLLYLKRKI